MCVKLCKIMLQFYISILFFGYTCYSQKLIKDGDIQKIPNVDENLYNFDMETAILKIEDLALNAQKNINDAVNPPEETELLYIRMITNIEDVTEAIKHSDNVYKFIKANGLSRILSNNLANTHNKLRTKLLILLKEVFEIAPTTTDAMLPLNIVDKLLDIFENDNLALKAHALDVLYKWLPNNPKAQIRVMKTKGLETFYNQINNLDVGVIQTLMELFNTILNEHLDARNKAQITKDDGEKLKMYQRIGLLERMATPNLCNGLLNIFEMLWSFNNSESDHIKTIFELMKSVKSFCMEVYGKRPKAQNLLKALLKYLKDENRKEYFEKNNINATELIGIVEEYMAHKNLPKDEF